MNQLIICDSAGRLYDDPRTILKATPSAPKSNFNRQANKNTMKNWIIENSLALYGAIAGTIALLLNIARFLITKQQNKRELSVSSYIIKNAQHNLNELVNIDEYKLMMGELSGPLYQIEVINSCNHTMYIHDVGILIKHNRHKERISAQIRDEPFLVSLPESGGDKISAGSSKKYSVWRTTKKSRPMYIPKVIGCFVCDQTKKEFFGKHDANGIKLVLPEKKQLESTD